jgi:hypothetical protein
MANSVVYGDSGVTHLIRLGKAVAASLMPIVSIVILYFVKPLAARLGIIAALTAVFSLTLCHFTSASIKDVFSATAAYVSRISRARADADIRARFSAVLVVFVGTTDS